MSDKKLSYFNKVEVVGVVSSFKIKKLANGGQLATIGVRDDATTNLTFVTVFDRKGLKYGDQEVTLSGLQKIFMDGDNKSRHVAAKFTGRARETVGENGTYFNVSAFKIEPVREDSEHYAILIANGIVDAIKVGEDKDDKPYARVKIGIVNNNRDGDITGVDYVTVFAHDEKLVEKLEDVEKHSFIRVDCDCVNVLPKTDRFGHSIGGGSKEQVIANINGVIEPDEIEEHVDIYKKAKRLERGEIIKVKKGEDTDEPVEELPKPVEEPKVAKVEDELDEDLDF